MLFNTFVFVAFAALFYAGWPLARRHNTSRWLYLICAALLFYGWTDPRYILLLTGVGVWTYACGQLMQRSPQALKLWRALGITGNLLALGVFKYLGFFTANINAIAGAVGAGEPLPVIHLALPLGISFYTFMALTYLLDLGRGQLKPARGFVHFFAYLSLWPQLLAGPITRARALLPQLLEYNPPDAAARFRGTQLIVHGLFKKAVIADNLAPAVNAAFGALQVEPGALHWWLVVLMYSMQIYCDFAGYSDIAIGLGKLMGLQLAGNFNHPYTATSIGDFWSRWHISLTSLLTDYLFYPLANRWARPLSPKHLPRRQASRLGAARAAYLSTGVTFVLCGLWHGAAWTFVAWGALHSVYLIFERWSRWPRMLIKLPGGSVLALGLAMLQVTLAWVFFRAASFGQGWDIITAMFDFSRPGLGAALGLDKLALAVLALGVLRQLWVFFGLARYLPAQGWRRRLEPVFLALVIVASIFLRGPSGQFIYVGF